VISLRASPTGGRRRGAYALQALDERAWVAIQ
jgi:hypothetical protein